MWVESGESMSELYQDKRKQLNEYETMMNKMYTYAQRAYMSNDGKSAKEYSDKGNEYRAMADKLRKEVVNEIFNSVNTKKS